MADSTNPREIDDILRILTPRVGDLESRARSERSPTHSVLQDAIEQLRNTVEELEVVREELLTHNQILAEDRVSVTSTAEWYHALFQQATEALVLTNTSGKVLVANDAAGRLLGVKDADLEGKPLPLFVHEGDRPVFRRWLNHLPADGEPTAWEGRVQPRGALPLVGRLTVKAGASQPGGEATLHWSLRDVTEERRAEAAREEVVGALLATLRSAEAATVSLDLDGTVLFWSPAAERLLGWSEDEVTGRPFPGVAEATLARLRAARDEGALSFDAEAKVAEGTSARLNFAASPMTDPAGFTRGTVVVLTPAHSAPAAPDGDRRTWSRDDALTALLAGGELAHDPLGRIRAWLGAGLHLGYLRPGDKLPSIRQVSAAAGVDHRAVSLAYRTLAAEGTVEVRDRHGVHLCAPPQPRDEELCESAEWLASALADAAPLQIRAELIPDMMRRWTLTVPVRCACVESCEDEMAMLTGELRQQWGMDTYAVTVHEDGSTTRTRQDPSLTESLRGADLVVTTPFHEKTARAAAGAAGIPLVVVTASAEVVDAAEERLAEAPLTVVAADAEYGRRLRALRGAAGGERLNVILANDRAALDALDPAEPVLLTRAAQTRLAGFRPRLLAAVSPMLSPETARDLARVLIDRNMRAGRNG